jgi:hypothetical protein
MEKRNTLLLIISLCFGILVLYWFSWSQFTRAKEEKFRAAILKDLSEAATTHESLRAHAAVTKKHYELYQAAIDRRNAEESDKTRTAWTVSSEQGCELEVLLRKQVATIEKNVKDRSGRLLPEWIRLHHDWQTLQEHLRKSEFFEPLGGCKGHYDKFRQTG